MPTTRDGAFTVLKTKQLLIWDQQRCHILQEPTPRPSPFGPWISTLIENHKLNVVVFTAFPNA